MKKSIFVSAVVSLTLGTTVNAQVSVPTNGFPGVAANYVGWNATRPFPLTVSHKGNFPINFETNSINRMTITPAGLVGIGNGTNLPLSMLHINSIGNTVLGEVFRTTSPGTSITAWRMNIGTNNNNNGTELFNIHNPANTRRIFLTNSQTGFDATLGFMTSGNIIRMKIEDGGTGVGTGRIAIGDNLPDNFTPKDGLHLYQSAASNVRLRFSHPGTGITATDGANLGIRNNGDFRLTQFEDQNVDIFTNSNLTPGTQVQRFRIAPNGQVFIGASGPFATYNENN